MNGMGCDSFSCVWNLGDGTTDSIPFDSILHTKQSLPLSRVAPLRIQQLEPNQDSGQQVHSCHAFQTTCRVSQPVWMKITMVPSLQAH